MKITSKTKEVTEPVEKEHREIRMSPFGHLFRFFGWWFGFTGLYAMFTVCPFCGQPGCPVGIASAGTVGAFFSLCLQDWKRLFSFLKQRLLKNSKPEISFYKPDADGE